MLRSSIKTIKIVAQCAPVYMFLWLVTAVTAAAGTALSLYFLQQLLDGIAGAVRESDMRKVIASCMGMFAALAVSALCSGSLSKVIKIGIDKQLKKHLVPVILEKFERIEYTCFETPEFRNTLERMSDRPEEKILKLYLSIMSALSRIFNLCGMAGVFLRGDWRVAVTFIALFAPLVWLNFKTADMMNVIYEEQTEKQRQMKYLEKLLSERETLFELHIFRGAGYLVNKWKFLAGEVLKTRIHIKVKAHRYYLLGNILTFLWLTAIVALLCRETWRGGMPVSLFVVLVTTIGTALDEEDELYMALQQIRWQAQIVTHYFNFMNFPETAEGDSYVNFDEPCIQFEHVSFSYPGTDKEILKDVSFKVCYGEHVALVGENGAGKSTIIKLLCRLYHPDKGKILMNGIDIRDLSTEAFQKVFSVVFQNYCHYSLSLRENVALGNLKEAENDKRIYQALTQAEAENIADLSDMLGKLEKNAKELSGGQWQRIAIARAFFADSSFVLLDEPTASLDPIAESDMYKNMMTVLRQRGCIFCSHRLASAKLAERILVVADGSIKEEGSHEELMRANGRYAAMYRVQSEWYMAKGGNQR